MSELSDEEKKAIEFLKVAKELKIVLSCSFWNNGEFEFNNLQKQQFDIILNLIEKQQKEIEELKEKNKKLKDKAKELIFEKQELTSGLLDSTPNDKIKAKTEEVQKRLEEEETRTDFFTTLKILENELQSLLEKE